MSDQIRSLAHNLWIQAGRPSGMDKYFWGEAERLAKPLEDEDLTTFEGTVKFYRRTKKATGTLEQFNLINEFLVNPIIVSLTEQTGLVHSSRVVYSIYNTDGTFLEVKREIENTGSFCNWWARFFSPERVLRIWRNGRMWCISYYKPQFFITASEIRDDYNEHLKDIFGNQSMVIVKNG